ncbi:MAG: hypothetical protein KAG80_05290 [Nocardioides sp.]|nr:hypothetical protein [Nocardioides sp.]
MPSPAPDGPLRGVRQVEQHIQHAALLIAAHLDARSPCTAAVEGDPILQDLTATVEVVRSDAAAEDLVLAATALLAGATANPALLLEAHGVQALRRALAQLSRALRS